MRCWGHNEEGQLEVPAEISQLDYRFVKSDFIYQDKASMEADQFHDLESRINKSKNPLEALNLIYKNIWQIPILDSLNLRSKLCSDYRNGLEVISLNPYEKSNLLKDLKVHLDSWLLCKEYFSVKLNPEVRKLASLFLGQLSPSDYIAVTSYLNTILYYRNQYKFDDKLSIKANNNLEFPIEKSKIDNDQSRHLKTYRDLHFPMDAESQRIFVFVRYLYFLIEAKQEMSNARTPN